MLETTLLVLAILGAVATIGGTFATIRDVWHSPHRAKTLGVLFALSLVFGIGSRLADREQKRQDQEGLALAMTGTPREAPQEIATAAALGSAPVDLREPPPRQPTPSPRERAEEPEPSATESHIVSPSGERFPTLEVIAEKLLNDGALSGTITQELIEEHDLAGLFTARITLEATVSVKRRRTDAFTLHVRGGGVTAQTARAQAIERLEEMLRHRLRESTPPRAPL